MDNNLELLSNISEIFNTIKQSDELLSALRETFKNYFDLKDLNIYIYDESISALRDFSKSWIVLDINNANKQSRTLYGALKELNECEFFFNELGYTEYSNDLVLKDENTILLPLIKNKAPYGIIELVINGYPKFDNDDFKALKIACMEISLAIQNTVLYEKMEKNVNFHDSMKNIAKIIETQYELSYIIPLIGEMIDKFIVEHLIYIFLKPENEDKFNLVWPLACRDKKILTALPKLIENPEYFLIDNDKIGIFPLNSEDKLLGCIVAHSNIDKLNVKEIEYLDQLTKQASATINRANIYAEVLKHATLDALTGINNRRQFETRIKQEIATATRQDLPLCAIMLDIDFFKKVNDTYGHQAGDVVLKEVANIITNQLRESDIPCRYGGEEFSILLPFTKIEEAYGVAQRLRAAVESHKIDVSKVSTVKEIGVTISVGVSEFEKDTTAQELYLKADKALYSAKTHGRNKVVIYNNEY